MKRILGIFSILILLLLKVEKITYSLPKLEKLPILEVNSSSLEIMAIGFEDSNIILNKGLNAEIAEGDYVLSENSLVGYIKEVRLSSSILETIITSKAPVKIKGEEIIYGIITDYQNGFIIVNGLKKKAKIGAQVFLNGMSNFYPDGILIGEVASSETSDLGTQALVTSLVDFHNLQKFTILKK